MIPNLQQVRQRRLQMTQEGRDVKCEPCLKEIKVATTMTSKRFRGPGEKAGSTAVNPKKVKQNYIVCKYCGFSHAPSSRHLAAACNKNLPPDKQFIIHQPAKFESVATSSSSISGSSGSSSSSGYSVVSNFVRGFSDYIGFSHSK